MLRSGDPEGVKQEMWALLAVYQALRIAVTDAVQTVPGTDPDRASYQIAVETAQLTSPVPAASCPPPRTWPARSAAPSWPACTARAAPRLRAQVKSPLSRWNKHPPGKPSANLRITSVTTVIIDTER